MTLSTLQLELEALADAEIAVGNQWFFKTGPGQYAEGDIFRGIRVPQLRRLAKKYKILNLTDAQELLASSFHEDRLLALMLLVSLYENGSESTRRTIYRFYLKSSSLVNNWDLVDSSAEHIVGAYLWERDRAPLLKLAKSKILWERRIAIISTFHFIKKGSLDDTFRIAELLLNDKEDLIHKATGWMLREAGKRDLRAEERFLDANVSKMPRTMLRYAIEKFPEAKRREYLER